ncbi:MAG TPA: GGDEF domain-containing protein [Polyangiaceae bacterium]|nr:GGDEF domain-containing protein [Polyangiaceae bacterium]
MLFAVQGPEQGVVFAMHGASALIGRESNVEVSLREDTISRMHARLSRHDSLVYVEDLGSQNGTFINDEPICQPTCLLDGDYLRLGSCTILKFSMTDELEERALCTLFELTLRDPLTRLYNRRYFDDRLKSEFSFARRHVSALALLLVDIDHFKVVNDTHGHLVGDRVLQCVAQTIRRAVRPEDVLARYGGEEFVLLARGMSAGGAEILAERIRHAFEHSRFQVADRNLELTVSVGVSNLDANAPCSGPEELVRWADEALYEAKAAGRNRISSAGPPLDTIGLTEDPHAPHTLRPLQLSAE